MHPVRIRRAVALLAGAALASVPIAASHAQPTALPAELVASHQKIDIARSLGRSPSDALEEKHLFASSVGPGHVRLSWSRTF